MKVKKNYIQFSEDTNLSFKVINFDSKSNIYALDEINQIDNFI